MLCCICGLQALINTDSRRFPLNLFSTNRGLDTLATEFVVTGFMPGLIRHEEQTFLEVV